MTAEEQVKVLIKNKIKEKYDLELEDFELSVPPKDEMWDYAFWAFNVSKLLKKNPMETAGELKSVFEEIREFTKIDVAWPYLNIFISKDIMSAYFAEIYANKEHFWETGIGKDKTIVVDYIWANVGKPLHIGHMCTPNQGQAMINTYRKLWYKVIWDNHWGDWGIIFGKLITAYKIWWDEAKLKENAVNHLFELYVKITKRAEDETKIDTIWQNFWQWIENIEEKIEKLKPWFLEEWVKYISHPLMKQECLYNYDRYLCYSILKTYFSETIIDEHRKSLALDLPEEFEEVKIDWKNINNIEEQTREAFKKLSEWDKESIELWQLFTAYSISSAQIELDKLHIKADFNIGESFYEGLNLPKLENYPDLKYNMSDIVAELIKSKVASQNEDNSVWVIFDEKTKIPSCMLQKRDGTKWYLASDLAAIKYRIENWNPEKIIYFVDVRQQLHLKQVFETAKLAGWWEKTEMIHAHNWFISLKDWAMSTRKWRIVRLDDLLNEAVSRAKNIILEKRQDISDDELESLSNTIWIWAIKYWYLSKNRTTDVVFDWDEFMTFEGNSGPYIQYAYVRARNILSKSEIEYSKKTSYNFDLQEETSLLKTIFAYNSILEETVKGNFPHILAWYAYELTKKFNSFYNNVSVLNEENEDTKLARLQLVEMFSIVLKDVFWLLAIEMPEKM